MAEYSAEYESFRSTDGLEIFYRRYRTDSEKARMIIAHGLGEHSGRYTNIIERLIPLGIDVWAPDHRGHGRSGGRRGHVSSFDQYVKDLQTLAEIARNGMAENVKIFLLGHSMGGLVALRFAASFPEMIDGVIASSPALGVTTDIPAVKAYVGRIMSTLWPTLSLTNGLEVTKISHDEGVVRAYRDDPLVHDRVSARWFTEFLSAMETACGSAVRIKLPLLMQLAGDDQLVNAGTSAAFFEAAGSVDKTLYIYKDSYHEIYNETEKLRKHALDDLEAWLVKHI